MSDKRRAFDDSYKLEIVKMIKDQGLTVPQVYRDQNIGETALRRWVQQYEAEQLGQAGIWQAVDGRATAHPAVGAGKPTTQDGQ